MSDSQAETIFTVHGFLIVASPVAEHRLWGIWSSVDVVFDLISPSISAYSAA